MHARKVMGPSRVPHTFCTSTCSCNVTRRISSRGLCEACGRKTRKIRMVGWIYDTQTVASLPSDQLYRYAGSLHKSCPRKWQIKREKCHFQLSIISFFGSLLFDRKELVLAKAYLVVFLGKILFLRTLIEFSRDNLLYIVISELRC